MCNNVFSEEFSAQCIAIETGLIPPTKPYSEDEVPEYDVTKFNEFWRQYSTERERVRKREVAEMFEYNKERYINAMLWMGCTIGALLIIILYLCLPE